MKRIILATLLPFTLWSETLSIYAVPKMHCPLCTTAVKTSLKGLTGVNHVEVRLHTKQAKIRHDDTLRDEAIREAIAQTGYEGVLVSRERL